MGTNKTFAEQYLDFTQIDWTMFKEKVIETLYMTLISMVFVVIIGFLLGLLLYVLSRSNKIGVRICYSVISILSNIFRSVPFIILILLLMPFSKLLVGTSLGSKAAIPSLIISAAPFFARMVETAFREVDAGVLEAADSMGASPVQKIWKVLIPESMPAVLAGITMTTVTMIGFTAMAGPIGGGGLGGWAYQGGFTQGKFTLVLVATVAILVIVFIVQFIGDQLVKRADKR